MNTTPHSPSSPGPGSDRQRHNDDAGIDALFPTAARFLPDEVSDGLRILGDYATALRAIVDHPALDNSRKEARLKAVADVIEGTATPRPDQGDDAIRAALTLRHLLESRELDMQYPWRMLQAAGQDIRKTAYPDWSDLLTWCRFWVGPMGRMAHLIAGGREDAAESAESFAIAVELLFLIERASIHYRWLGRVYLPQRWFREAGAAPSDLAQPEVTAALRQVIARAHGEVAALLDRSRGMHRLLPSPRVRIAAAIAHSEARAWAERQSNGEIGPENRQRGFLHNLGLACGGVYRGLRT